MKIIKSEIINKADKVIAKTYNRFPIVITKGKGCTLWDSDGRAYTDFVAGIAVCNLGHAHPRVAKALSKQAKILFHVSNLYYTLPQIELASWLVNNSFADRVFFCNSGAEANEAAIKLVRKYFNDKGEEGRCRIIAMEKSFHGRTMATLSATGQEKIRKGFDPVLGGFDFVPFNDIEALRSKINPSTCAVIIEPIQGEGGVRCPAPEYLKNVRRICDETGILLIFDEIQTGLGRTGKLFAYENFGIEPDVMTLAKALANGLPIGAMLAKEHIAEVFVPGSHASTFGGTPVVTAASLEVVKILIEENIIDYGRKIGEYFKQRLFWLKDRHKSIVDVRGIGLLLGMKIKIDGDKIVKACMEKGFLINCIQGNILRFIPPLIIGKEEIDSLVACMDELFDSLV
ncbi:MAG: aspartate aminotransferase family protein [Proteobacteria bacterium]|nr:aspartate aminotransferase family protein [Desulfobacteraceae bacterium]MBU2522465.1 aspartate aminotransferase family protein [Pseudomonadota bacterium]MBU3980640.1 aspartate aminotransferase family protein [Pseudomonadota bacterium]MBU4013325.1 aspartate aminotransferase family protein [Pseudomonadota bacterium]MBU4066812.1 aspartate aminotransferase family protein [Pseudomonadota bacterium]